MNIALDYDGTYTADPNLWLVFIAKAQHNGHRVICVTMRYSEEQIDRELAKLVDDVVYTGRKAKKVFADERGLEIDIWIDDSPMWLLNDSA